MAAAPLASHGGWGGVAGGSALPLTAPRHGPRLATAGGGARLLLDAHPPRAKPPALARLFLWRLEQILGSRGNVGGSGRGEGVGRERVEIILAPEDELMRPKPNAPGGGPSFARRLFFKDQRGYVTGPRSPSGQNRRARGGRGDRTRSSKSLHAWAAPARMRGSWPRQARSPALEHSCVN